MIRFVLDTNVLVSIALSGSRLLPMVGLWKEERCRLLVSQEIFEEYLQVLAYPKFRLSFEDISRILERQIRPYAESVRVHSKIHVISSDPSDNKFLACAVDGDAHWIVTGDHHLLDLKRFRGIQIGSPKEFLNSV